MQSNHVQYGLEGLFRLLSSGRRRCDRLWFVVVQAKSSTVSSNIFQPVTFQVSVQRARARALWALCKWHVRIKIYRHLHRLSWGLLAVSSNHSVLHLPSHAMIRSLDRQRVLGSVTDGCSVIFASL